MRPSAAFCASSSRSASSSIPTRRQAPAYDATPERRAAARKVAEETFVLLKNDPVQAAAPLLPLTVQDRKDRPDWPPGRQPARDAGRMGGQRRSAKYVVTLRTGAGRAAGRPAALRPRAASCSPAKTPTSSSGYTSAAGDGMLRAPLPTTQRPSPKRSRRPSRPTWRFWRWASRPTGWKAKPQAARRWVLPARRSNCLRPLPPPASR